MTSPSVLKYPQVDDWLSFEPDGTILVRSGKVDIGQRISAALVLLAAEQLDVDPALIRPAIRETDKVPDEGYTSGSRSMTESGNAVRLAAATARRYLLTLACERLGTDELEVADGLVRARGTNRSISYWQLAEGRPLSIPIDEGVMLKPVAEHRFIGHATVSPAPGLTTGATRFVHDMALPGMLHARVIRPPHVEARLLSLDPAIERNLHGGLLVRDGSFLAVAHANEWTAIQLATRIAAGARWSELSTADDRSIFLRLLENRHSSRPVIDGAAIDAPLPPPLAPADEAATVRARFRRSYQMHASIGPSAALAHLDGDRLTIWTHSQGIYQLRQSIAEALGRPSALVHLIHAPGSGCYGHNGADDAAFDAALVACALPGKPVLLKWTRADEHGWEPYGSAMIVDIAASLGPDRCVTAWSQDAYSDTHVARPRPGPDMIGPARLLTSRFRAHALTPPPARPALGFHSGLHRNLDPIYEFPHRRIIKHLVHDLPLRTSSLRGLGALVNVLAIESVMDELAELAGTDRIAFRLQHLVDPRARRVVETAAERLRARDKAPNTGRGFGFARYKNSAAYTAVGIELDIDDAAQVWLRRAAIAADVGEIVDRQGIQSQLEGGLLQAASLTLYEQVTYDRSGITSRDWDSYPILRFDNVPEVETILIEQPGAPFLGVGEAAIGPTAAAIANAIYDAVGLRIRCLPMTPEALRAAALT